MSIDNIQKIMLLENTYRYDDLQIAQEVSGVFKLLK